MDSKFKLLTCMKSRKVQSELHLLFIDINKLIDFQFIVKEYFSIIEIEIFFKE